MSYILDALKKAEQERGAPKVPTLSTVHDSGEKSSHRFLYLSITVLVLLACGLGLFLSLRDRPDSPEAGFQEYTEQRERPDTSTSVIGDIPAPKTAIPSSTTPQRGSNLSTIPGKSPLRLSGAPKTSSGVSSASAPRNIPDSLRIPGQEGRAAPAPQQDSQQSAALESSPAVPLENSRRIPNPPSGDTGSADNGSRSTDIPARESTLQQAMKEMSISILSYSEIPSERIVFINGRKYNEGDYIDGRFLLKKITQNGVILSFEGAQALLKPGMK